MSSRAALGLLALLTAATVCPAQNVDIYPEFRRPDPFGKVVPMDRALAPREILSPGVARNAFASFHIVVTAPPQETYLLYVVPNPVSACRVDLYKEHFVQTRRGWVPDTLAPVTRLPDFGVMPDPDEKIPGQTTRLYLLDLWIPPNADVARFRLEVQLKVGDWVVRPMEVRIMKAQVPDPPPGANNSPTVLPAAEQPSDASARFAITAYASHGLPRPNLAPGTVRDVIWRNALQDMRLAGTLPPDVAGPEALQRRSIDLLAASFRLIPSIFGAEWYLRLRDFLYTRASAH